MPRKKKNTQSPARGPGLSNETGGSFSSSVLANVRKMAENETNNTRDTDQQSSNLGNQTGLDKEDTLKKMQGMFPNLDHEVVYMVLSECDFKVENAMDSLIELSMAAEGAAPLPPLSGFDLAAALLGPTPPQCKTAPLPDSGPRTLVGKGEKGGDLDVIGTYLTADFDMLLDQELEEQIPFCNTSLGPPSSFHPPDARQVLPELIQSSVGQSPGLDQLCVYSDEKPHSVQRNLSCSPVSGLSFAGPGLCQEQSSLLDFSHLTSKPASNRPMLELAGRGRPSAFQAYKKSFIAGSTIAAVVEKAGRVVEGAETLPAPSVTWNTQAAEFQPRSEPPAFITPVVFNPVSWNKLSASHWSDQRLVMQAPLKPAAIIPESWAQQAAPKPPVQTRGNHLVDRVLLLLRGAPGSGKSTLARSILAHNPCGVVLSTDDFFSQDGNYCYDKSLLGDAHEWNQMRAKTAVENGVSPILIDNTNMQRWEMKPYVAMALKYQYKVMFREPDTWWKFKPRELQRRTKHGVQKEKIKRMLEGYEHQVSVHTVMCSSPKPLETSKSSNLPHPETSLSQPLPNDVRPDLVEEPQLNLGSVKGHFQLFSSLPDVSSVGEVATNEGSMGSSSSSSSSSSRSGDSNHISSETLLTQRQRSQMEITPDKDLRSAEPQGACVSVGGLDKHSATSGGSLPLNDESTPEFSTEDCAKELPVAFCESIGQRVRRDRGRNTQASTNKRDGTVQAEHELGGVEATQVTSGDSVRPELLDFVGDWPSEALNQREQRTREGKEMCTEDKSEGGHYGKMDLNVTEFQKLLDLLQVGTDSSQKKTDSPLDSALDSALDSVLDSTLYFSFEDLNLGIGSSFREPRSPLTLNKESPKTARDTRPELLDRVADWTECEMAHVENHPQSPTTDGRTMTAPSGSVLREGDLPEGGEDGITTPDGSIQDQSGDLAGNSSGPAGQDSETLGATGGVDGGHMGVVAGNSQERRLRQSRRAGKQCKLALTFTNNSPTSPRPLLESPQSLSHWNLGSFQPPLLGCTTGSSCSTQTNPKEFALLWRIDRQRGDCTRDFGVTLKEGHSNRFLPKLAEGVVPLGQQEVPYRVFHDKGTQVEELELSSDNKRQNLQILHRHFKLVSFDTLEDLYDKCHQDMEWTTNLLLDSGEQLFREDGDDVVDEEHLSVGLDTEPSTTVGSSQDPCLRTTAGPGELGMRSVSGDLTADTMQCTLQEAVLELDSCSGEKTGEPALRPEADSVNIPEEPPTGQCAQENRTPPLLVDSSQGESGKELEGRSINKNEPPVDQTAGSAPEPRGQELSGLLEAECNEGMSGIHSGDTVIPQSFMEQLVALKKKEKEEEQRERKTDKPSQDKQCPRSLDIQSLELKLPAELAFQLSELFGPVGIDPGTLSPEDCTVQIDLNLAKLLYQKWKDTIQERQRQGALSYHLLRESSVHWGESQSTQREVFPDFLIGPDGLASLGQSDASDSLPFMDHWNISQPHVSLRDIMSEELALQENVEKFRSSHADGRKDGASLLKENQLFALFPTIDPHFLKDIFKDHNYSLEQTEHFLRSLLDGGPVKTVVAPEATQRNITEWTIVRENRHKPKESEMQMEFQNTEDPEYVDFRAEATLQRRKQDECFSNAAEAHRKGMKEVASFYAQQGHLHAQKMKEANHRAAVLIFERVNASLLPQNVLDLHGLHVEEALHHLRLVLEKKTAELQNGECRPELKVITGRGSHSQGGVARIRPAVIDHLSSQGYRFTEPRPGLLLVMLH